MPTVEISCEFTYEAAHWLPHVPEGHQCGRMHGHSYHLIVTVAGPGHANGFVIDFADTAVFMWRWWKGSSEKCLSRTQSR